MYSEVFRHGRENGSHILAIGLYHGAFFLNKFSVMKAIFGIIKMF
jgi:hypothetical protein